MTPPDKISKRYYISGTLVFNGTFHVGTSNHEVDSDRPTARDISGKLIIPGTSMAGVMRNHLARFYSSHKHLIEYYFGYFDAGHKIAHPSLISVEDLYPEESATEDPEASLIRDGIMINRQLGAARHGYKYDYETSLRQKHMALLMTLQIREGDQEEEIILRLMGTLIRDMEAGRLQVGGMKTIGSGRFNLINAVIRRATFPKHLRAVLLSDNPWSCPDIEILDIHDIVQGSSNSITLTTQNLLPIENTEFTINAQCNISSPFLVKDGMRSTADTFIKNTIGNSSEEDEIKRSETDAYFLKLITTAGTEVPVVPGSSMKGVWRSRSEKILRTLGHDTCDPADLVEGCQNDCLSCKLFGTPKQAGRVNFNDAEVENFSKQKVDGVAINRFTGGTVKHALYDAMPMVSGQFSISIRAWGLNALEKALLIFVLRDFVQQDLPLAIGSGRTAGFGLLSLADVTINGTNYADFVADPENQALIFDKWQQHWEEYAHAMP